MNFSALPELMLAWAKTQATALLQSDKAPAPNFQPGQQYEGKVVDNLVNGRQLVKVGVQLLDMNLPAKTQPGDTVRLTYLNAGPRPTFLLNQASVSPAQQVQISNAAQQVNVLLRMAQSPVSSPTGVSAAPASGQPVAARAVTTSLELPQSVDPEATPSTNSPVGVTSSSASNPASARPLVANVVLLQNYSSAVLPTTTALTGLNTGLLSQAVDGLRAAIPASTTLSANTLVELPSAGRHLLPVRLSQTVSESGMFYESHLAKWSTGSLSLEAIQREPQARLGQEVQVATTAPELGGMPEEAARLASRQLQMLEGAPFIWQGQAWPGQSMDWLVREENGSEGGDGGEQAFGSDWVTELNLILPRMGTVHAQLGLAGDQLRLRLQAADETTRDSLLAALPLLTKGFEASGLKPVEMQVVATPNATADANGES